MASYVREVFQQVMIENMGLAKMSDRVKTITDLFTELGKTELHTYFTPQGVDTLASIVFSTPDIRDFVFNVSTTFRLELAFGDTPFNFATFSEAMAKAIYSEGPKPDQVPGRAGDSQFYLAKQTTDKSRLDLINANEWLPIVVLIRANLTLLTAQLIEIATPAAADKPLPNTRQSQGKIPA